MEFWLHGIATKQPFLFVNETHIVDFYILSSDFSYPIDEIAHRLNVSGSGLMLTDTTYPVLSSLKIDKLNIETRITSITNDFKTHCPNTPIQPALVLFTSGTTGKPKGVVHSFEGLNIQLSDISKRWDMSSNDELFLSLPLNHIHGLITGMFNGLFTGSSVTIHSQFDATSAWNRLSNSKTSFFTAVPAIYSKLHHHHFRRKKEGDLNHIRLMISGSSPLSEPLLAAWTSEIRREGITERYGMTETGMISTNAINLPIAGAVGKSFPSIEIKIDASTDQSFGQVLVKGPGLFDGYLTSSGAIIHDKAKFFNTGDQGYFNYSGDLVLVGRDRDILKVNGYKVGCGEIESAILSHSSVQECVVLGLADTKDSSNQIIAALITSDDKYVLNLLRDHLSTRLSHYKIPRRWIVSEKGIPRNLIGKPDHFSILSLFNES